MRFVCRITKAKKHTHTHTYNVSYVLILAKTVRLILQLYNSAKRIHFFILMATMYTFMSPTATSTSRTQSERIEAF